ncbi:MAG TPA: M24 family metallopeptidase, partial [Thermoanaerobaculia bacterium]|nr:M24 family metallopeptidase [Thermoanaerobaculia bacterium]
PGRVALAGHPAAGEVLAAAHALEGEGWAFADGSTLVRRFRQEKMAWELAEARRVAAATCEAFRRLAARLAGARVEGGEIQEAGEPLTVARLRREVAQVFAGHGLEQPSGNLIAPGEEGGVPHNTGTASRVLRPGETLIVDLFPKGLLYADCTRTFAVGPVPEAIAAAHEAVAEGLALAHREARPGRRGWDLQEAVCGLLAGRGYPTPVTHPGTLRGYVHGLGHGVGHELHEYPAFTKQAGAEGVLGVGDLVTLEPGLYEPGEGGFGLRLEDMVWLGPDGPENLTPLPYDLDPAAWSA